MCVYKIIKNIVYIILCTYMVFSCGKHFLAWSFLEILALLKFDFCPVSFFDLAFFILI